MCNMRLTSSSLIVWLWHVLELRLHHASRHGGHRLATPRGSHHVSHVRAVGTNCRGRHSMAREGSVGSRPRDDGEDLSLPGVGGRLVVGSCSVHLLEARGGGRGAWSCTVLGGSGSYGWGVLGLP
jgi:hypothetical protein